MPMRHSAPHHHDKPYSQLRRSNWNLIGQVVMKKNVFLSMVISIAVWGGDFHTRFCERVRVKLPRSTWPVTHTKAVLTRLEQSVELVRVETSDTLMAHSEEAQQHYQQRGRDALQLLHLQVPQPLRKVKMVERLIMSAFMRVFFAENVVNLVNILYICSHNRGWAEVAIGFLFTC